MPGGHLSPLRNCAFHGALEIQARSLTLTANSAVSHRPDGKSHFYRLANNVWVADADSSSTLAFVADANGFTIGYRLWTQEGELETYDWRGGLSAIQRIDGSALTITRDSATQRITKIQDRFGRAIQLSHNPATGLIASLTDPAGAAVSYAYDAANRLESVTYPDTDGDPANNPKKTYHYAEAAHINNGVTCPSGNAFAANLLTGITDENGSRYATYKYDCQGRAVSSEHWSDVAATQSAERHQLTYTTDANGNPLSSVVTDPVGGEFVE